MLTDELQHFLIKNLFLKDLFLTISSGSGNIVVHLLTLLLRNPVWLQNIAIVVKIMLKVLSQYRVYQVVIS